MEPTELIRYVRLMLVVAKKMHGAGLRNIFDKADRSITMETL